MYIYSMCTHKKIPQVDLTFPGSDMCEINTSPPATWRVFVPPLTMTVCPELLERTRVCCGGIRGKEISAFVSPRGYP